MHRHATVSAWRREHDGTYHAEIDGFSLEVRWHPEAPGKRRGFSWSAKRAGGGAELSGGTDEPMEEMEAAMAAAELAARRGGAA